MAQESPILLAGTVLLMTKAKNETTEQRENRLNWWKKHHALHLEEDNAKSRQRDQNIKILVLSHYSTENTPICARCGIVDIDVLAIDHIMNNGNSHRRLLGIGAHLYGWLKRNNYPEGYQVLCMNCNWKKRIQGGL